MVCLHKKHFSFSVVCLTHVLWNTYASILIDPAVYIDCVTAYVLLIGMETWPKAYF